MPSLSDIKSLLSVFASVAVISCTSGIPDAALQDGSLPLVSPEYAGTTIPCNIAPLTFTVVDDAEACITRFSSPSGSGFSVRGKDVTPKKAQWRKLMAESEDADVTVTVYEKKSGKWIGKQPFRISVSSDPIDAYISYRLIEPTYEISGDMAICQRRLSDYSEKEIYSNKMDFDGTSRQCINCHSYQAYGTSNMQFHVRQRDGGTIIFRDGKAQKVNLKAEGMLSAGVYPSWHPSEPLIAYSLNSTKQYFFAEGKQAAEVIDSFSDVVLYDPDRQAVSIVSNDPDDLESFPYWAPDGKSLYYCCASTDSVARAAKTNAISNAYDQVRYNIIKRSFDAAAKTFGPAETILDAASEGMSATLPRPSPVEPYLLFTMAPFGNFHIWHKDSDLYLMDLRTGEYRSLDALNSSDVESYHSWSSNGRWIIFSSRRDDGRYTRFYIAYFSREGVAHKPFILPQADPGHDGRLFKSYNIPEFMTEPVPYTPKQILKTVKGEAVKAHM